MIHGARGTVVEEVAKAETLLSRELDAVCVWRGAGVGVGGGDP